MRTIDPKLEIKLQALAQQEHCSPDEIVSRLVDEYIQRKQESGLLIDIVQELPEIVCFNRLSPLEIQKRLRDEWR